ncbi:MAG: hypothetical protein U0031_00090 [Thermomicrobiales bacterium]
MRDGRWPRFKKLTLALFGIALLVGVASTALVMGHQLSLESWRILFILAVIVLVVTSTVLVPGVLLPALYSPHPEFLSEDLADEWTELRQRRISRPHVVVAGGVIAAFVYLWCLFYYGKVTNAFWFGWFPVGAVAIGLALLLFYVGRQTSWYVDRFYRTPTWVLLLAFVGYGAAIALGISMTEVVVVSPEGQRQGIGGDEIDYSYIGTRGYSITRNLLPNGVDVSGLDAPDCDDDSCGYIFLAILVIVLVLILVAGAALIPHMWVVSGLVLLTLIALLALHDLHRDRSRD